MATEGAAVRMKFPPALYAVPLAVTLAVHRWLKPLPIGAPGAASASGTGLMAAGIALGAAGAVTVLRRGTTVVPDRAVTALVTSGPYRFSRNPMYTGLTVGYVGAALRARSWWPLLVLPAIVAAVRAWVIGPEEQYLAERFGTAYTEYSSRVRRWL